MSRSVRTLLLAVTLLLVGVAPATAAPPVPAPVVTEAVALSDTQVRVTWTPVDRATSYELRWSLYGTVVGSLSTTATAVTFTSQSSYDYLVEVRALRAARSSGWSDGVLVSTPPATPTEVVGTALRPDLVELSWAHDLDTLTHEVHEVADDGTLAGPVAVTSQGGLDSVRVPSGAATTTTYVVVARGFDGTGSAPSDPVTVTTPDRWPSEVIAFVYGPFDEGAVTLSVAVASRPDDPGAAAGTMTYSAPGIEAVTSSVIGNGSQALLPLPAGVHDVLVEYSGDSAFLPSSTLVRIEVRPAVAAFLPGETVAAVGYPYDTAVADATGDGVVDLVASVSVDGTQNRLALWRGLGDGAFADPVLAALPSGSGQLALGDLDRDGDADAVVAAPTGLVVVPGGAGGFGTPTTKRVSGTPVDVAVGDVTADGAPDVVLGSTAGLQVLPGNGRLGWGKAQTLTSSLTTGLVLGDTTGDGRPEIAGYTGSIEVWSRPGTSWTRQLQDPAPGADGEVALGDVTGDGRADLTWTSYPEDGSSGDQLRLRVSLGTSFAPALDLPRSYTESGVATGDLTGDGRADVVSGSDGYSWLSVWQTAPDGSATPPARVESGQPSLSTLRVVVADLDGDGRDDVLHVSFDGMLVLRRA